MTNATTHTPQEIIEQGRANNMQSAKRLLEIERLEKLNDELLAALKSAKKEIEAWRSGLNTQKGYKSLNNANVGACFMPMYLIKSVIAKAES